MYLIIVGSYVLVAKVWKQIDAYSVVVSLQRMQKISRFSASSSTHRASATCGLSALDHLQRCAVCPNRPPDLLCATLV